jgi:hypothetical protein
VKIPGRGNATFLVGLGLLLLALNELSPSGSVGVYIAAGVSLGVGLAALVLRE